MALDPVPMESEDRDVRIFIFRDRTCRESNVQLFFFSLKRDKSPVKRQAMSKIFFFFLQQLQSRQVD